MRFAPDLSGLTIRLAKNQSVTVLIPVGPPRDVVTVHKDAVLIRGGDRVVYAVEDGKAVLRRVTLGERRGRAVRGYGRFEAGRVGGRPWKRTPTPQPESRSRQAGQR